MFVPAVSEESLWFAPTSSDQSFAWGSKSLRSCPAEGELRRARCGPQHCECSHQRGLGLLAIDGPAERRLTRREVVGLTRIVLQNFPQTIVHSISGGSADVGPGSGVEHDLNEVIASQLETIV